MLIDEASAELRMQIESEPHVLAAIKRKLQELQVEKEALKMDENASNDKRLEEIEKELADAQEEGHTRAARSFEWAWEVEKIHEKLYTAALEKISKGEELEEATYWVCGTCGHTFVGDEPPERCPICGAKRTGYMRIE